MNRYNFFARYYKYFRRWRAKRAGFFVCIFFVATPALHAKLFLLLDERLKKNPIEQSIYKFVPLTNASEVELIYVRDFLKETNWITFVTKMKVEDRGMYIGADRWPEDTSISNLTQSREWSQISGKISVLVDNTAPEYARMPKGLLSRREIWKKYADLTATKYVGYFSTHYLDTRPVELKDSNWPDFTCVNTSGRELKPDKFSPLTITRNHFRLNYRKINQLDFTGLLVCVNTPKSDAIFEINAPKTDVALETETGRFSVWNEAQPLKIKIMSSQLITAPLELQIVPENNASQTEFFFQGDKVVCTGNHCRKKAARFLMPAFRDFIYETEIAMRASGDSYFRGTLRLMAGEIEVARAPIKFTPYSWITETGFAFRNPSEYKSTFLFVMALVLGCVAALMLLWSLLKNTIIWLNERQKFTLPRQSSATTLIQPDTEYLMTASQNPFGCELIDFGGIVSLCVSGNEVKIRHGGIVKNQPLENFCYQLPDGYVVEVKKMLGGELLLETYLLDLSKTGTSKNLITE